MSTMWQSVLLISGLFAVFLVTPVGVEAQDGPLWCVVKCNQILGEDEHVALQEGDEDDWDGGFHDAEPYEGSCCWWSPGEGCKHEACFETEEQEDIQAALPLIENDLANGNYDAVSAALVAFPSLRLNLSRRAIQVVTRCDDSDTVLAWAHIPVSDEQFGYFLAEVPEQTLDVL